MPSHSIPSSKNLRVFLLTLAVLGLHAAPAPAAVTNIDAVEKYAWSENAGWVNFRPTDGGARVYGDHLEGFAWAENLGWIQLGSHDGGGPHTYPNTAANDWGVNHDGGGGLSGYAWSEVAGWINFSPSDGGVTVDPATGRFDGYAWSENLGWISFPPDDPAYGVSLTLARVTWVSSPDPDGLYGIGDTVGVTVEFSSAVSTAGTPALTLETGTPGAVADYLDGSGTGSLGFAYTVSEGEVSANLAYVSPWALSGTIRDRFGLDAILTLPEPGAEGSLSANADLIIDGIRPTAALSSPAPDPVGNPFEVTVTFSEPVTGFDPADLMVTNGTAGDFSGGGETYTVSVIPSADGVVSVDVPADVAQDAAGNGNFASATLVRTYLSTGPEVTLTTDAPDPTNTSPINVTATFSRPVTGFDAGDLVVSNGTVSGFAGGGAVYSFMITPTTEGLVTVKIPSGVAEDSAGNGNLPAPELYRVYDVTGLLVILESDATDPTFTSPINVTVTFSEPVTGFEAADVVVTNGTLGDFAGEGETYTVSVIPSADGLVTVKIPAGVAWDVAGNGSLAAVPLTRVYDGTNLIPVLTSNAPDPTGTSPLPVTVTFSRPVTGLEPEDVTVTNGTVTGFDGAGDTYTIAVTPSADGPVTVTVPADVAQDSAGNGNFASAPLTRVYLSTRPEVTLTTDAPDPTNTSPINVTATFSRPVTGFDAGDLVVTNGTVGDFEGSGDAYTFTVTPSADGVVSVDVPADVAQDAAGNANLAAPSLSRQYRRSPTITVNAGPDGEAVSGETVTLDGTGSTVADDASVGYRWTQTGGPAVSLSDPESPVTRFTAPAVDGDGEVLTFELAITDGEGGTFRDWLSVSVTRGQRFPSAPPWLTGPDDGAVFESDTVRLTATPPPEGQRPDGLRVRWQVRRADRGYGCPTDPPGFDRETDDLTGYTVSGVHGGRSYAWRAGYVDPETGTTSWSEERTFTAGAMTRAHTISVPPGETVADYRMIAFPVDPGPTAEAVLGDLIGDYDPDRYRIGVYDPLIGGYIEYGEGVPIEPGRPIWVLARHGLEITVQGTPASPSHANELDLEYDPAFDRGWNMIAAPDGGDYPWGEVELLVYAAGGGPCELETGPTTLAALPDDNPWIDKRLWRWENGEYRPDTAVMTGGVGYWVRARSGGVTLRFPEDARTETPPAPFVVRTLRRGAGWLDLLGARRAIADDGESPPAPPAAIEAGSGRKGASGTDGGGGGCFIEVVSPD